MSVDKEEILTPPEDSEAPPVVAMEEPPLEFVPEKKVVVNEEPEFFDLDPNSTEVKPVVKPPPPSVPHPETERAEPSSPPIDEKHLSQIIPNTLDIIDKTQKQSYDQQLLSQKLSFMLGCIKDSICNYGNFLGKMNNFLVNNERLQSIWFCKFRSSLRCYGDYTLVLKDTADLVMVDSLPNPVPEKDLKALADQVVNTLCDGGAVVSAERDICKSINDKLDNKREFTREHMSPFDYWFLMLNKAAEDQNHIMDSLFKVSAQIGFLKTGEVCESPDALARELDKELGILEAPIKS